MRKPQEGAIARTIAYMNYLNEHFKKGHPLSEAVQRAWAQKYGVSSSRFSSAKHLGYFVAVGGRLGETKYKSLVEKFDREHAIAINSFYKKKVRVQPEEIQSLSLGSFTDRDIYEEFRRRAYPLLADTDISDILKLNGVEVDGTLYKTTKVKINL